MPTNPHYETPKPKKNKQRFEHLIIYENDIQTIKTRLELYEKKGYELVAVQNDALFLKRSV